MAIRRKRKNISKVFAYAFSLIFVFIIIVFGISYVKEINSQKIKWIWFINVVSWTKEKVSSQKKIYANSIISGQWLIKEIPYNMQVSTSYELLFSWKKFFAKSDNYLLWNYVKQTITFSGVVVGFSPDNIPVIDVTFIKWNQQFTWDELRLDVLTGKVLNKDWLIINLENIADNLKVKDLSGTILIYQTLTWNNLSWNNLTWNQQEEIVYLKIVPFKCNNLNSLTDCRKLQIKFRQLNFNTITNDNGLTFYKLPETNQYEAFSSEYWYYVYPLTGNFYSLINAFSVIDTKQNKLDAIKNACKISDIQLTTILDINFSGNNYQVIWMDQNSNKVLCKLTLTMDNNTYVASLQSLDYLRDENISTKGLNENNYLIYKSRAYGFSVYMPKWIKYKSDLVNKNFWISGLRCLQLVNIAHRKKWKLTDPDVKVYYCKSQVSKYLIENWLSVNYKNFKVINKNNKVFVIIYKDDEISKKILNYLKLF